MKDNTQEAFDIIRRNFDFQDLSALANVISIGDAKKILALKIREMLDKNLERLIGILYRIDISQKKIDDIFAASSKDKIASDIAGAVIERQLLKIQTREQYKTSGQREIE